MNTIVIVENEIDELEYLVEVFKKWHKEINILTVYNVQAAINIISKEQVDLIVCDLSLSKNPQLDEFSRLTSAIPYVPSIAIVQKGAQGAMKQGACFCLERPFTSDQLLQHTRKTLKIATIGTVEGIATHNLLQMLESEEKTCSLKVISKEGTGLIYMKNGTVIGAETGKLKNKEAVYLILAWEEAVIEIRYFNSQRQQEIHSPLISLIMEAFRLKDERNSRELEKKTGKKAKPQFKLISTVDRPISLGIGVRLKMEFINPKASLMSMVVGMHQDKYIIVTTPSPFSIVQKALDLRNRILVKYIYNGKLFVFKTTLLKAIDDPHRLLFLSYPPVIRHHEFRSAKRTTTFIPCTLQLPRSRESQEYQGALLDMSSKGALWKINSKGKELLPNIKLEDQIQLRCLLPGFSEEQSIFGYVKNIKKDQKETRIGIEFNQLENNLQNKIESYLYSIESLTSQTEQ